VIRVVGVGADGWSGLSAAAQSALSAADVVLGSVRQLALLPSSVSAERVAWPSPLLPALQGLLDEHAGRSVAVLASGDPMFFGIGSTLARLIGPSRFEVLPHPSSVSLACARLGWPLEDVEVISLVGRPLETLHPAMQPGRRLLVLVSEGSAASAIRALLDARGFSASTLTVLENLGSPDEQIVFGAGPHESLAVVAVVCAADPGTVVLPRVPGLPDEVFEHTGQITKREIRALSLALLAPVPGQLLWDVGAGSGSIGIEWMRVDPSCRAIAIEPREDRRALVMANAASLGVPGLEVIADSAPSGLLGLPAPDAIFIGGGVSAAGVVEACVDALRVGGRLVANGVTLESDAVLASWHARLGGSLTRVSVERAGPLGSFTAWRPALPVTVWSYGKDAL